MYLSKKLKRKLPSYLKLEEFKFDINKLREATSHFEDEFIHLKNANSNLEKSHSEFVRKIADVYFEVPLTIYSGESTQIANLDPEGNTRIKKLENYPLLDEWNYGKSTPRFLQSYFYECCQALGMPIYRVRLAKLIAGGLVDWHIDYDPSYATRIIIPIVTSPEVFNSTKRDSMVDKVHMPADGHAWFINTGFPHNVENFSNIDRYSLIISVNGENYWNSYLDKN